MRTRIRYICTQQSNIWTILTLLCLTRHTSLFLFFSFLFLFFSFFSFFFFFFFFFFFSFSLFLFFSFFIASLVLGLWCVEQIFHALHSSFCVQYNHHHHHNNTTHNNYNYNTTQPPTTFPTILVRPTLPMFPTTQKTLFGIMEILSVQTLCLRESHHGEEPSFRV
jgi:hypothetical protein